MKTQHIRLLRLAALFGALLVALKQVILVEEFQPRQEYGYYALYGTALAVVVTLAFFRRSSAKLLKNPDILVPLGLYLTAAELFKLLPGGAQYLSFLQLNPGAFLQTLSFGIVAGWLLNITAAVIFAGWTTRLILQLAERETVDLVEAFRGIGTWFWRTLAVLAVFALIPILLTIPLFATRWSQDSIMFFIYFAGAFTLVCNLATYAVLLVVLNEKEPVAASIADGVRVSCRNVRRAFLPVVLQMLIVGWVVMVSVHYSIEEKDDSPQFGKSAAVSSYSFRQKWSFKFSANFLWVGEYENKAYWHKILMSAVESKPLPPVDFKISLLLLLLAVVVKIEFVRKIYGFEGNTLAFDEKELFEMNYTTGGFLAERNKIKGATVLLLIGAAVYLLPFEALTAKAGGFLPSFLASDSNPQNKPGEVKDSSEVVVPKVYSGEDAVEKRELFRNAKSDAEKSVTWGAAITSGGEKPREIDRDALDLNDIEAIYAGEFDGAPGTDILVAGDDKAFVLDARGSLKRIIDYDLGKYFDGESMQEYDLPTVRIVDLNGDGRPEIAGDSRDICAIMDLNGKAVWKYKNPSKTDMLGINSLRVDDLDGDGRTEIIVGTIGLIEVFSADGSLKWKARASDFGTFDLDVVDLDGSGRKRVVAGKQVYDETGKVIDKIEVPYLSHGFITQKDAKSAVLFFENNKLGLFGGDGKLLAKYEAPLSDVPLPESKKRADGMTSVLDDTNVIRADAMFVRLRANEEKYLAVYAQADGRNYFHILYIYDPEGRLIYCETVDTFTGNLSLLPKENGTESILITDGGKLFEYSLK